MIINGKKSLCGGTVDSYNDHRIAMSAAIASLASTESVTVTRFEAINKSYPTFAENFE
jgi:3-phosphoshikimate 1-carboxyvinyltransferase